MTEYFGRASSLMRRRIASAGAVWLAAFLMAVGCAPAAGVNSPTGQDKPQRAKTITVPILNTVAGFTILGGNTSNGGWDAIDEIHSNALITTEPDSRRIVGMLLEKVPSI